MTKQFCIVNRCEKGFTYPFWVYECDDGFEDLKLLQNLTCWATYNQAEEEVKNLQDKYKEEVCIEDLIDYKKKYEDLKFFIMEL